MAMRPLQWSRLPVIMTGNALFGSGFGADSYDGVRSNYSSTAVTVMDQGQVLQRNHIYSIEAK